MEKSWYVYMLRCRDDSLYTGMTDDLEKRLASHNAGKGAKYTRGRGPVELVYREACESATDARKREFAIKQLNREEKLALISGKGSAMTLEDFEKAYARLGPSPKTADIDRFSRKLLQKRVDVSFLRKTLETDDRYFRAYFYISTHSLKTPEQRMAFVEDHFHLMRDWWHTDTLIPYLGEDLDFDYALQKAREYVKSPLPYARRWGYVLFIPRLVRDPGRIEPLFSLFQNEDVYHVVMAEAWLLSYLAMCDAQRTIEYLKNCDLAYNIVGKAIQKICDSYVISPADKARFKALRPIRRK